MQRNFQVSWAQWDSLRLMGGVLYRLWESPAGDRVVWQIVVPKKLQREVFSQLHSSLSAGHFGVTKTLSRVRERFYWASVTRIFTAGAKAVIYVHQRKVPPRNQKP